MTNILIVTFWISASLVIYVYIAYPLALGFLAHAFRRWHHADEGFRPTVSLLISAYNESGVISRKTGQLVVSPLPHVTI